MSEAPASAPESTPEPESGPATASSECAPKHERRKLPWQRKLLFASAFLVLPVLLLEGGLRLIGWPTDRVRTIKKLINFDPETFETAIGVFQPGTTSRVSWPPELAYTAKINSLGLRGPETTLAPAPDSFRVLCLGDSTTFGFYVEEHETLPQQLQRELRTRGAASVEVVNGGCGGWSIQDQTDFFLERAGKLEPKLVVLTFCGNDLSDLKRERSSYESQKAQLGEGGAGLFKKLLYSTACYELILRIKIASKRSRLKSEGREPHPLSSVSVEGKEGDRLWARYETHLTRLRDALRERQIPLVVSYLPDAWRLQEGLEEVDDPRLSALCERLEIPYVTSYGPFEARPVTELFHAPTDAHQNAQGNTVMAEVAAEFILKRKLVPTK